MLRCARFSHPTRPYSTQSIHGGHPTPMTIHMIGNKTFVRPRGGMLINLDHVTHVDVYRQEITFHSNKLCDDWSYHYDNPEEARIAYRSLTDASTRN